MRCPEASELMSLQLDSALHPEEELALQQHLFTCESCRAEWEAMRRACALFHSLAFAAPGPDLSSRGMASVRRHELRFAIFRNGIALTFGVVILTALCLSFWMTASSPVEVILGNPPLASAIASIVVGVASVLGTLLHAAALVVQAVLTGPGCAVLLGYVAIAGSLTLWWVGLVTRRAWPVPRGKMP